MYSNRREERIAEVMAFADREGTRSPRRPSRISNSSAAFEGAALVAGSGSPPQRKEPSVELPPAVDAGAVEFGLEDDVGSPEDLSDFRLGTNDAEASPPPRGSASSGRRLRKPFFKSWEDFMEFDINIKHKMPITLSEFELLLQKEAESCKGWDVPIDRKDIKVAKIQGVGLGGITLRAWAVVPGVNAHVAFHLFYVAEQRMRWDKVFAKQAIIASDCQGSDILYSHLKPPVATARDFLQYRRVRLQKDGSILIALRSAEHPDFPEDPSTIRAESYISGYVLRQEWDGHTPMLRIFLMSSADVKGLIPKWIVNHFAPRKPGEWVESLRKAAVEFQESNPDMIPQLQQNVQRFAEDNPFDFEADDGDSVSAGGRAGGDDGERGFRWQGVESV